MANREDGHIPSSDPRDSVVFQQVSYLDNYSHLMLGLRSVFDYRTDTKKPRWQIWWWWKTMRISHTRQPSRPIPPSAKERLSALGNVGNRRGNVNSDCEKVRGTFQGNMIFGRWENLPSLFPSHPMSAYFLADSKPMVFFHIKRADPSFPAGQWWGLMFPLPPMLIEVMIVKV